MRIPFILRIARLALLPVALLVAACATGTAPVDKISAAPGPIPAGVLTITDGRGVVQVEENTSNLAPSPVFEIEGEDYDGKAVIRLVNGEDVVIQQQLTSRPRIDIVLRYHPEFGNFLLEDDNEDTLLLWPFWPI